MGKRGPDEKPKPAAFTNSPFKDLKKLVPPKPDPKAQAAARKAPSSAPKGGPRRGTGEDEEELFAMAMGGVMPLQNRGSAAPPPKDLRPKLISDDAESLAQLAELVSGQGPFQWSEGDEQIAGVAPGVDPGVLLALRKGSFAVQGRVDLERTAPNGMTPTEALGAVERFLLQARRDKLRCVLVVHDKGPTSRQQLQAFKSELVGWLDRGRIAKLVLAFATARPQDGGAGALYVLLRR